MNKSEISDKDRIDWISKDCFNIVFFKLWVTITRASDGMEFNSDTLRRAIDNAITDNFYDGLKFEDLSVEEIFEIESTRYVKISPNTAALLVEKNHAGVKLKAGTHIGIDKRCPVEKKL